jgi:hypothetical protein
MGCWVGFLDLKRTNVRGVENTVIFCAGHKILNGSSNQEEWDCGACGRCGKEERCVQGFGGEI